jgi:precorrin-2 dehydrogenase/sirohydrochlorin ferrochelatase
MFPLYVELSDKEILLVGGGNVALRKLKSLLRFTKAITLVAPRILPEIKSIAEREGLRLIRRRFIPSDLKGKFMVIVAVDDLALQKRVFNMCKKRGILCNSVDSPDYCNFLFPSLVVRGELVIGINTSGKAPAVSKKVREIIESCIPKDIDRIVEIVAEERNRLPKGEQRQRYIVELVDKLLEEV